MADLTHKLANRKRAREDDDPLLNDADEASPIPRKKKPQRAAIARTYNAEDALKVFTADDLRSLVEKTLQDEATRALVEDKLFAASNRIGERIATKILEDAEAENAKVRELCAKKPKRRVAHFWPAELEPYLDQIKSQLLEGPYAQSPKLAWRTLILFLDLCVDEWESHEENDFDEDLQDEVEEFHELAQEIMLDIWAARERVDDWREWFGHADRRQELDDLRDNAEYSRDSRYETMYELLKNGD
ncbi:hypothetical protein PG990_008103 [Apiospora arundinis]